MSQIYPSLLSADFSNLKKEIEAVQDAGADGIHFDVMDGHFVPNLSFGAPVLKSIRPLIQGCADCHLMVQNPENLIEDFAKAGANRITVHQEATQHLHRVLRQIKDLGCESGVAINPATPFESLEHVLDDCDLILSMTVNPGFGGQKLIPGALEKTKKMIRWLKEKSSRKILVQVDGGINQHNAEEASKIGVDILVAGNAVFSKDDYREAIDSLRGQQSA